MPLCYSHCVCSSWRWIQSVTSTMTKECALLSRCHGIRRWVLLWGPLHPVWKELGGGEVLRDRSVFPASTEGCSTICISLSVRVPSGTSQVFAAVTVGVPTLAHSQQSWYLKFSVQRSVLRCVPGVSYPLLSHKIPLTKFHRPLVLRASSYSLCVFRNRCYFRLFGFLNPLIYTILLRVCCKLTL